MENPLESDPIVGLIIDPPESTSIRDRLNQSQPKSGKDKVAKMSPKIEAQKELTTENQIVSSF